MDLYRLMTEVRAGAKQSKCVPGQSGLVTIWVRAKSETEAFLQAKQILEGRNYQSRGELAIYREETSDTLSGGQSEASTGQPGGELPTGYEAIKQEALSHGDGLFETWFPLSRPRDSTPEK